MIKGSILTFEGYKLPKKNLTDKQFICIKKELTVKPINSSYAQIDDNEIKYKVYVENDKFITVPRYYGVDKFGPPEKISFDVTKVDIKFNGKLRDYQEEIINISLAHMKKYGGGLIAVPCGTGKTLMAIYIAHALGLKTLVLTHKSFLQEQWINRIEQFTGEESGIIRQNKVITKDKNFAVGMIQSISKREYDLNIFKEFSLVIIDEAHRFASKHFSKALFKVGAKYTLALSATPRRVDGLMKVTNWFVGDIMYQKKLKTNNQVITKIVTFYSAHKLFAE